MIATYNAFYFFKEFFLMHQDQNQLQKRRVLGSESGAVQNPVPTSRMIPTTRAGERYPYTEASITLAVTASPQRPVKPRRTATRAWSVKPATVRTAVRMTRPLSRPRKASDRCECHVWPGTGNSVGNLTHDKKRDNEAFILLFWLPKFMFCKNAIMHSF